MNQNQAIIYEDNVIYRNFKPFFELGKKVLDFSNECIDYLDKSKINNATITELQDVITSLCFSSRKTYYSILILCNKGHGEDAMNLTRTIFENFLVQKFIQLNPEEYLPKFSNYQFLMQNFFLDKAKKNHGSNFPVIDKVNREILKHEKDILETFNKIKLFYVKEGRDEEKQLNKFKYGKWAGIIRSKMAEMTDLIPDYENAFSFHSCFTHPNIFGLKDFCLKSISGTNFKSTPSEAEIFPALPTGIRYFLLSLREWANIFNLVKNSQIDSYLNELTKLEEDYVCKNSFS